MERMGEPEQNPSGHELLLMQCCWTGLKAFLEIMPIALVLVPPGWMLETLTALAVAGRGVDAPAGLELQCCGPPPDVSLQLSQGSVVPS